MDEELKAAIQAIVDARYASAEGPATLNVRLITRLAEDRLDRTLYRNEVEAACDELVAEARLAFLGDHGEDGRRYCSVDIPQATIDLLREPTS